jgi:hypothetical protein
MQVKFSWVQLHSCGTLLFSQAILTRSPCPVFLARQACWTLAPLGWICLSAKRPMTELWSCQGLFPLPVSLLQGSLAEPCSPTLCWGLAFSAQRTLLMSKFLLSLFSYWSPTTCDIWRMDPCILSFGIYDSNSFAICPSIFNDYPICIDITCLWCW